MTEIEIYPGWQLEALLIGLIMLAGPHLHRPVLFVVSWVALALLWRARRRD